MTTEHQTLALLLFSLFIAVTLGITTWVSRNRHGSAEEFYAGGRLFSPMENGFAIAGDYMSAASFLGISHVVTITRVAMPDGRGSVFISNGKVVRPPLRLTLERYAPRSAFVTPPNQVSEALAATRRGLCFSVALARPVPVGTALPSSK